MRFRAAALAAATLLLAAAGTNAAARIGGGGGGGRDQRPGAHTCKELFFDQQRTDHFDYKREPQFYSQRYFLNDTWYKAGGPIFFYAGNEAPVEAYVGATGLMWENAEAFSALIVFAEHRYYGKSQPFGPDSVTTNPSVFSVEQAMADYVELVYHLKSSLNAHDSPVILFGGSYGGMLAGWLKIKYPHVFAGAIAASAPVGAFVSSITGFDPSTFWKAVTADATPKAGAAKGCDTNTRRTFHLLFDKGARAEGRQQLADAFQLCDPLRDEQDVTTLAYWIQGAFDSFAMGNYPYPSDYIAGSKDAPLPAWPMRAACSHLGGKFEDDAALLKGMKAAMDVLYNVTQDQPCYKLELTGPAGGPGVQTFLYQFCTDAVAQELPFFPANGKTDMFWDQGPYNQSSINEYCRREWGVVPRPDHLPQTMGVFDVTAASNIVWSNGGYDPWHVAGILEDVSDSNVAVWIPEGAHHLDLMFSHPDDPPCVKKARKVEVHHMKRWVKQHYATRGLPEWQYQDAGAAASQPAAAAGGGLRREPKGGAAGAWQHAVA